MATFYIVCLIWIGLVPIAYVLEEYLEGRKIIPAEDAGSKLLFAFMWPLLIGCMCCCAADAAGRWTGKKIVRFFDRLGSKVRNVGTRHHSKKCRMYLAIGKDCPCGQDEGKTK